MRKPLTLAAAVLAAAILATDAWAVADETSGKDDCEPIPAGSSDWTEAFESWYHPNWLSIQAGTQDIYIKFNGETSTGKKIPAGQVMTWGPLTKLSEFMVDRSAADSGVLACWWQSPLTASWSMGKARWDRPPQVASLELAVTEG